MYSTSRNVRAFLLTRTDADWWLSGPEVLEQLEPNNRKVTAYYLPDEEGKPTDVLSLIHI